MIADVNSSLYSLYNLNKSQSRYNYKLANNKELQYGSDDSMLFDKINSLRSKHRNQSRIRDEINRTELLDKQGDTALTNVKTQIDRIKELLIKANTSTTTGEGLDAIAKELEGIRETLLNLANTSSDGQYSFSGNDASIKPFTIDANGKIVYNGNDGKRKVTVDEGTYKDAGVNGYDAFFYTKNSGLKGESVSFSKGDKIIDQDGNEWTFDESTNTLNKKKWDGSNEQIPVTANDDGTYSFTVPNVDGNKFDAKDSVFNLLDDAINGLKGLDENGDKTLTDEERRQKAVDAQENIDKYINDLSKGHALLGSRNASLLDSKSIVEGKLTGYELSIKAFEEPDLADVAIKLKELEITFESLYTVISKTNNLSLLDHIK